MAAAASCSPAPPYAICRRSRISPALKPRSPMSRPGSGPGDDPYQARYLLEQLGLTGDGASRASFRRRRRGALRWRACWRPRPTSCCSTSRPTISISPPSNGWKRELGARRGALVLISHDRRFLANLSRSTVMARSRPRRGRSTGASRISRNGATRCWPRRSATSTSSTARSSPKSTGCATASRVGASATSSRLAELHALRRAAPRLSRHGRQREPRRGRGRQVRRRSSSRQRASASPTSERSSIDFSIRIQRGDRIGIVGPNGAARPR